MITKTFVKIWFAVMQLLDSSQGCGHSCVRGQVGYIPVTESSFCGYIKNRIVEGTPLLTLITVYFYFDVNFKTCFSYVKFS